MRQVWKVAIICCCLCCAGEGVAGQVTVGSLLREMTDPVAATYLPETDFRTCLWSSHDRASVSADRPGWFANDDASKFVRDETNDEGQVEHVMMDARGPGAVVRCWMTFGDVPETGTMRIYVDGKKVVEGRSADILTGDELCGAPLAAAAPAGAPEGHCGNNLYFPVTYAKNCKMTISHKGTDSARVYYNIETRTYGEGTQVESFGPETLAKYRAEISAAQAALAAGVGFPLPKTLDTKSITGCRLEALGERAFEFSGPGVVREIVMDCDFQQWRDAMPMPEEIVLSVDCDGERTVEMPAVDFFGAGPSLCDFSTRFCARRGGTMTARWAMPFKKSLRVTLRGGNDFAIPLRRFSVSVGAYDWQEGRSMLFRCKYTPYRQIRTRENGNHRDLRFLTVNGRAGRLVGCGVFVRNPAPMWWGEGDEKIFVDGEKTPSYIGTGSEDHFGYAWGCPDAFSHPFLAQPDGSGALRPGVVVNLRHRVLDAVEFRKSIVFDMELWHWRDCLVDYDAWCWYYAK